MSFPVEVSIAVTTFNMEGYIAQALDSWLMQKTTFSFEIVISDDGSTDSTREIIINYQKENPNIRLICTGHIGKMPNFIRSMQECQGKYISLCDGDDYWIDEYKLQKQFDFMEQNPDFSSCFTNSWVIDSVSGNRKIAKTQLWDIADSEDFLAHGDNDNIQMSPGHTSTFFFRNRLISRYPQWMYGDVMTDFPTYMLVSRFGKSKFINECTSVYRHRPDGVSSINFTLDRAIKRRIFVYENINRDFDYKYKKIIDPILSDYYFHLGKYIYKNKSILESIGYVIKSIRYQPLLPFRYILQKLCK